MADKPNETGDLGTIAQVKRMADEQVYRYVERGAFLAKVVYGAVAAIVAITLYLGHLAWTLGQHETYIRELSGAEVRPRIHTIERHLEERDGFKRWVPENRRN